ncbi:MAG: hypothetical protein CMJ21_00690 [Phycisphaerae bacterium]|nr:hypothetical protein [Phycisphaerae bacterium]
MTDAVTNSVIALAGSCVLVAAGQLGDLSPRTFARAHHRRLGLTVIDLFVGITVFVLAGVAFELVLKLLGWDRDPTEGSPRQIAVLAVVAQLVTQWPVVMYVVWRVGQYFRGRRMMAWSRFGIVPQRPARDLGAGLLGAVVAVVLVFGCNLGFWLIGSLLDRETPTVAHKLLIALGRAADDPGTIAIMLTSALVLAPLLEEVIFRGLVQTALLDSLGRRRWLVIVFSALFFAAVHGAAVDPLAIPGLFVLGMVLGWLYERTDSLWPGVIVHVLFNTANVGLLFVVQNQPGS